MSAFVDSETILEIIKTYVDVLNNILEDRIGPNGEVISGAAYVGNVNVSREKRYAQMYSDALQIKRGTNKLRDEIMEEVSNVKLKLIYVTNSEKLRYYI